MRTVLIIPALDPPEFFLTYVKSLFAAGFRDVIVVDDGSRDKDIFSKIKSLGAVVLTHPKNLGKGAALKYAFAHYLNNYDTNSFNGVITLDSDGQHLLEDVVKVAEKMEETKDSLVLGCRDFSLSNVPPKSKYGNNLTKGIFKTLLRLNISDTQTGLRGIPNELIKNCIDISGDRFEYETRMLIELGKKYSIAEVSITTVYLEENKGTHFNPVVDSIKIYGVIFGTFFRYLMSSLASFFVDITFFTLFAKVVFAGFSNRIAIATVLARIISAIFNFTINRNMVFKSNDGYIRAGLKYGALCLCQMGASAFLVSFLFSVTGIEEVAIKLVVDTCLFVVSYNIQKYLIFTKK